MVWHLLMKGRFLSMMRLYMFKIFKTFKVFVIALAVLFSSSYAMACENGVLKITLPTASTKCVNPKFKLDIQTPNGILQTQVGGEISSLTIPWPVPFKAPPESISASITCNQATMNTQTTLNRILLTEADTQCGKIYGASYLNLNSKDSAAIKNLIELQNSLTSPNDTPYK